MRCQIQVLLKDRFLRLVLVNDAFCELLNQKRKIFSVRGEKVPDDQRMCSGKLMI